MATSKNRNRKTMSNQNVIKAIELIVKDESNVQYSVTPAINKEGFWGLSKPKTKTTTIEIKITELL